MVSFACRCIYICVTVCMLLSMWTKSGGRCWMSFSIIFILVFWEKVSDWTGSSLFYLQPLAIISLGSTRLWPFLLPALLSQTSLHTWHFAWMLEFKTLDCMVVQQALYPLNCLSSTHIFSHEKNIELHQKTHRRHSNCNISISWGSCTWKVENKLYFLKVSLGPLFSLLLHLTFGILCPLRCGWWVILQ